MQCLIMWLWISEHTNHMRELMFVVAVCESCHYEESQWDSHLSAPLSASILLKPTILFIRSSEFIRSFLLRISARLWAAVRALFSCCGALSASSLTSITQTSDVTAVIKEYPSVPPVCLCMNVLLLIGRNLTSRMSPLWMTKSFQNKSPSS